MEPEPLEPTMSPVSLLEMMPAEAEDGAEGLLSLPSLEELLARTGGERRLSADIVRDLREQGITDEWIYNQEMSLRQPVEDWASVKASPEWAAMTRDEREERALAQVGHVFWHLPASYRAQPGFQAEWERAYEHFYENEILPIITTPGWGGFKEHLLNSYESTRANHAMLSLDAKVMRRSSLEADLAKWRALPEDLLVTFSDQPGGARGARQVRQVPVKLAREITQNRINYLDQDLPRLIEELQERKERIEQRHGWKGAQLFRDAEDLGDFWAKASGKDWAEAMGGLFLESGFSLGVTMLSAGVGMTVGGVASENPAGAAIGGAIGSSAAAYVVEYPARLYQEVAEHLHKRYPGWDQDGPVTLDEPIMVDGELVSTRVYTAEDRAELLLGVLGDEGVMKELRTRAARGAGAVAVTEGFTSALSFKISSDIFRNFQRGSAWKSTPLQAKTRAGLASLMATQPVGAAGGSAGEFLAYLFEGKDPTTGQAQKEIFAEGAIELFGAPIEVAGSATSLSLEGGAQWVQRRQQIKEHAQKAAQAMDAWDADALRAAQVPEERIAELEGTSNPVKRMELAQQYLQEADDVALEGIEYERLEDGGTRVRYPDGQEATYPDAQSMVDGHIQWREGREVLQRRLLSQEAASKDAVVEAAQHQLKLLEMDELEERSIDLPEKSVAGVIRAVRAVVAGNEDILEASLAELEALPHSVPVVRETAASLQQRAADQATRYRQEAENSRSHRDRQELTGKAQRAETVGQSLGTIVSMLDRAPRRRVRLSGRKRRSQGKGRSRDVVVEIRDHLQRAKDEMDRRVSLGEDPQKVAEDLTRESLEQGALSEAQENAGGNQSLDQVRVLGSNRLQRAGNYRRALIKLYNGADVLTVAHEFGELWLKEMVEDGVYTWEEVAGWVNAAREKLGESGKDLSSLTQPGELQTYAREGWVDLYELYLLDQHHSLNLPQKVLEYFRKLTEILSRAVKRALMLREALASESLPAELKQSFQDAARMHFREETTGFSGRADGNEISGPDNETLQAAEDSTNYSAASEWDERGEIPDAEFELIPEFLEDGTEEELRILLRLRPSQRPQRRLYNLRRVHEAFAPIDVGNQIPSSEAEEGNVGRWNGSPRHRDSSAIQEAHRKEEDGRGFLIDDPNLAAYANADVVLEKVSVNLSNIEEQFQSFGEDEIGARRFIDALLDEEIIHYLERWPVKQRGEDGWASFIHLADSALEDQSRAEALVQAWNGYQQIPRDAPEEVRATVAKLRRSRLDGYRAFGELIRQIIQLRTTGRVTEQVEEPTVLEGFSPRGGYETFVRVVSENVLEGKWGQELKAVILDTEARFESLEDPSIGPAEPGETTHSLAPENPNQRFRLLQGTQEQASPAELDLVRRLGLSRNTQIRLLQLMSEAQANGRQRPVLVEDDTLQDAGAQYEPDEGIIRINPAILEEEATQFEDRIDRRRMIDAIIDEELIHWHLAQSYQQPSAAEVEEAYEAMMERFVSEYPHVLLEAYRTYTKSHSPDLKPISLEEFMSDDAKVAEAFDEFVRQIVQLQTTGRITEEVSHPWPERDLGPSCWLGKYRDSLEHSYRMALGRHWGAEMQAIVEQAEARAQTAVETYSMAPDESDQWGPSEAELELERWKEQAGDAEFIEMVNLTSRMRAVQAKHKHHLFPQEKRK